MNSTEKWRKRDRETTMKARAIIRTVKEHPGGLGRPEQRKQSRSARIVGDRKWRNFCNKQGLCLRCNKSEKACACPPVTK